MEYADAERKGWTWERYEEWASVRPLGRMGTAQEVAKTILFLASGLARHSTGATIDINGASYVR